MSAADPVGDRAPILSLRGVSAGYGAVTVLSDIALNLPPGGALALLGPNGAGKTTCLRAISGLCRRQGDIRLAGRAIARARTDAIARLGLAHATEGRGGFLGLSALENLCAGALARPKAETAAALERVLALFPALSARLRQPAGALSGGEQQMLAIGRALMTRPRVLLLDEPSLGLAPRLADAVYVALDTLRRTERVGLLIAEQSPRRALALADRAALLETGRLVRTGPAADFADDAALADAYLGASRA